MYEAMEAASAVLVRTDEQGLIVAIISSDFLEDTEGWLRIDEGYGSRYRHAQTQYLPGGLRDENGCCRWKLEGGQPILRSAEEIAADLPALPPLGDGESREERIRKIENQIAELYQTLDMLLMGVVEDE